jgi:SAM-dependent methyltransferase
LQALTEEVRVGAWAEVREPLELQLAPLGRSALEALAPHPGESVLDIGCGGGETALDLARAVAPDGTVVGIDLSAAVLAFAQRAAKGSERVRFVQADAQVFPFEPASFDAVFSRFGVMFFADPTAAFINIRRSLRPNGRLAFWLKHIEPTYQGYWIGKWIDTDGDGKYDVLEVETRGFKGPRVMDGTGLPLHRDNRSVIRERIFLDKTDPTVFHDEITVIDNALTRPWTVDTPIRYRTGPK